MNDNSNSGPVSKLVSELLKKFIPSIDNDEKKQIALRRYCMRILGSAIGANGGRSRNATFVNENIKKRLIRARPHHKEGENTANHFDLLYRRLETSRVVRNKWAILSDWMWVAMRSRLRSLKVHWDDIPFNSTPKKKSLRENLLW